MDDILLAFAHWVLISAVFIALLWIIKKWDDRPRRPL